MFLVFCAIDERHDAFVQLLLLEADLLAIAFEFRHP